MINSLTTILSNPTVANIAQNSASRVAVETTLKSIGRPGFILIDNDIDRQTKRYAATKEFLYQATCLLVYLAVIPPIFKRGSFKLGQKLFKAEGGFNKFKSAAEYLDYHKIASKEVLENRKATLNKDHHKFLFNHDGLREELLKENGKPEKFPLINGVIEFGTLIGSVLGLAILAPEVSHKTIHPLLRMLGMEKKPEKAPALNKQA